MKATRVRRTGTFSDLAAARKSLSSPGDLAVVARGRPRWIVMNCPDGCGEVIPINLDNRVGPAWKLYERNGLSLYPSVWRESGCESHFIIWRNRIWWGFEWDAEEGRGELEEAIVRVLQDRFEALGEKEIAELLDEEPWDVLVTCNRMAFHGRLERSGKPGSYRFSWKKTKRPNS